MANGDTRHCGNEASRDQGNKKGILVKRKEVPSPGFSEFSQTTRKKNALPPNGLLAWTISHQNSQAGGSNGLLWPASRGGGLPGSHSSALPPHQDEGQVSKIPCGGPACPHKPEVKFNQKFRFDRFQQIFNLIGVTMF